eukprot:TRINITY_DN1332_c0_g1_i2.p1 TRINITY_DN1332_c0_g1~~TRINITY_DN1332_c0_g1_i2.p1  ORF type:complete len:233 (-),score=28.84 TRINITY_DN1332_c0_g1_i2:605-1303(-)
MMSVLRLFVLSHVAFSIVFAAGWGQWRGNARHTNFAEHSFPSNVSRSSVKLELSNYLSGFPQLVTDANQAFFSYGNGDTHVVAVDVNFQSTWNSTLPGVSQYAPMLSVCSADVILAFIGQGPTTNSELVALNKSDGSMLWSTIVPDDTAILCDDKDLPDAVLGVTSDETIIYKLATGEVLKKLSHPCHSAATFRAASTNCTLILDCSTGEIASLDIDSYVQLFRDILTTPQR